MTSNAREKDHQKVTDYQKIIENAFLTSYFSICHELDFCDGEDGFLDLSVKSKIEERCQMDFVRISARHSDIMNPDEHKVAAYATYWICKLHPIQSLPTIKGRHKYGDYLNEILAFCVGIAIIQAKTMRVEKTRKKFNMGFLQSALNDFLYALKYCNQNPDILGIMYYFVDELSVCKA